MVNVKQAAATSRGGGVVVGLVKAYVCVSPALATELALCADLAPDAAADALAAEDWQRLHTQWLRCALTLTLALAARPRAARAPASPHPSAREAPPR